MNSSNDAKNDLISRTLFFSSIKDNDFDYSYQIKNSLSKFCGQYRAEASPNLFEYLCYKIIKKQISENKINQETAIISEKFLSSKDCKINIIKSNSIQKKFILIPIRHSITHKWNAIIFVHLERQIMQHMYKSNDEPIVAKIISSNLNSEEDDFILNTTMDKIENAFNFTSPEDIQFEVDSINISDQPNTSIFLLNFIHGLISQESNSESVMNYIMKLYDESGNTNNMGINNYFISFNRENEIFNGLMENYIKELKEYIKVKNSLNLDETRLNNEDIFNMIQFVGEEDDVDSEEEALNIARENEEARKQMEDQELFFNNRINGNQNKNVLGLIQEAENESDEETERKSIANLNNNHSLIQRNDDIDMTEFGNEDINENKSNLDDEQNNDYNVDDMKSNNDLKRSVTSGKVIDSENELEGEKNSGVIERTKKASIESNDNSLFIPYEEQAKIENNLNNMNNDKPMDIINNVPVIGREDKNKKLNPQNNQKNMENVVKGVVVNNMNKNVNKNLNKNINKKGSYTKINNNTVNNVNKENNNVDNIGKKRMSNKSDNKQIANEINEINKKNCIKKNNTKENNNQDKKGRNSITGNKACEKCKLETNIIPNLINKNISTLNQNLKKIKNELGNNQKEESNNNTNSNKSSLKGSASSSSNNNEKTKNLNNPENKKNTLGKPNNNNSEKGNDNSANNTKDSFNNAQIKNVNPKYESKNGKDAHKNNAKKSNENITKVNNLKNNEDNSKISLKMRNLGQEYIGVYKNYNNNDINKNIKIVQDDNILENSNNNFLYESCQKPNNNSKKNINTNTKSIQSINSVENKNNLVQNKKIQEFTNRNESKLNKYIEIISQDDTYKVTNSLNEKKKKNLEDNVQFSLVPDDGTINSLSSTLSPNKTLSIMNNIEIRKYNNENKIKSSGNLNSNILQDKEDDSNSNNNMDNTYKTSYSNKQKTSSDNNSKTSNFTISDSLLNGKNEKELNPNDKITKSINNLGSSENSNYYNSFIDEDSKIENNNISKENDSTLQRRTLKKLRHRGGPEKKRTYNNNRNDDYILRDYVVYDECAFNTKDLKCGCTGNLDKACSIF